MQLMKNPLPWKNKKQNISYHFIKKTSF